MFQAILRRRRHQPRTPPLNRSPPNEPKLAGAIAAPHGALRFMREISLIFPLGSPRAARIEGRACREKPAGPAPGRRSPLRKLTGQRWGGAGQWSSAM
jgi:hypothetical protein